VLLRPANWSKHSFGQWLEAAAKRMHHNVVAAAVCSENLIRFV
jgi:transposase